MESPKILIVDDVEMNREMLRVALSGEFSDFLHASNGVEAFDLLSMHQDVSLVLLDMSMPVMDGFEVLSLIKHDTGMRSIPVIVVTASREDAARALGNGADDFLTKPFDPVELSIRVRNQINKKN